MKKEINLLPKKFQLEHRTKKINPIIFLPLVLCVIVYFSFNYYIGGKVQSYNKEIQKYKAELNKINKEISKKQEDKKKVSKLQNALSERKEQYNLVKTLLEKESKLAGLFRKLTLLIPDRVWLQEIEYERNSSSLVLVGKSFSHGLIKKFVSSLQNSYNFGEALLLKADSIESKGNYLVEFKLRTKPKNE